MSGQPRPGSPPSASERTQREIQFQRDEIQFQREKERRRQVRGLVLLAVAAIVFAILRTGVHRVFTPGWWRLW